MCAMCVCVCGCVFICNVCVCVCQRVEADHYGCVFICNVCVCVCVSREWRQITIALLDSSYMTLSGSYTTASSTMEVYNTRYTCYE